MEHALNNVFLLHSYPPTCLVYNWAVYLSLCLCSKKPSVHKRRNARGRGVSFVEPRLLALLIIIAQGRPGSARLYSVTVFYIDACAPGICTEDFALFILCNSIFHNTPSTAIIDLVATTTNRCMRDQDKYTSVDKSIGGR